MKINNPVSRAQGVTGPQDVSGGKAPVTPQPTSNRPGDTVSVSPLSSQLQALESKLSDVSVVDSARVDAIKQALAKAKLSIADMDLVEINEAFSPQYIACEKALGFPREKGNVNGGAIAIGHPLGASGARLTLTLLYEMRRRKSRYGVASLCIGGGQGIAAIYERIG